MRLKIEFPELRYATDSVCVCVFAWKMKLIVRYVFFKDIVCAFICFFLFSLCSYMNFRPSS